MILVAPVLLGDGTRLFDLPGGTNIRWERVSSSEAPQANGLWYRVIQAQREADCAR